KVVTTLGTKVSKRDEVKVNDIPLEKEEPVYYMLYKPRGVISSVSDPKGRKVLTDFFEDISERIFPIGRLDYHTSGLILITNDRDIAKSLKYTSYKNDKRYSAK